MSIGSSILCHIIDFQLYLTYEEGWIEMYRVAGLIQPHFTSWMEYYHSYAVGRQYWRFDISEENALHGFYLIERLKQDLNSPINKLAWQTELPERD
ncbi:DUF1266 domain-containing protein [Spartinivicinus poritis]|uniref:DUF1266 domain-containing protein n=1 Tax=Spartinivicinus poritis TaxID=2994640 RepID=A0ABT5UA38_9GAMM|nr:DUF1266 domain-containing protein [Spartinivicinus sp. A2-2]MDE1463238.1 DUF1266 domain-containing protein [Spartinivicinus sp. A2-2]